MRKAKGGIEMLELKNIQKTFNTGTVDEKILFNNFNFHVDKGEFVSVIGSNGSGKTTMLNIVSGDIAPQGGAVYIDGENITSQKNYKRSKKIARVFQNPAMGTCPSMTVFENLSIFDNKLKPYNLTAGLNKNRKDFYKSQLEILNMGLEDRLNVKAGSLSGGQRQALALVMATLVKPDLLLLDEHTAALDPKSSDIVMKLTDRIIREKGITTLMVTHNLKYALEYSDRFILMHEGKIAVEKKGEEKKQLSTDDIMSIFNKLQIIGE